MISRKKPVAKKKAKSKRTSKRSNPSKIIENLIVHLNNKAEITSAGSTGLSFHFDGLANNIEDDIKSGYLNPNSTKSELINYLKAKKYVIEGVIVDL